MQEEKRRTLSMLITALALCSLPLLGGASSDERTSSADGDGARRTVYYQDASCRLETFREFEYEAISIQTEGTTSQVAFGECYARGSTGAITTCDTSTGLSTVETYLDNACQVHLYSSKDSPECTNLKVDGETCPPGGPASSAVDCVPTEPLGSIHPGPFNLIGSPYKDKFCLQREGGDHIVPGHAFGIGNGECSQSPLVRGPRYALTECREDHTVYAQVFSPEDEMCSGDLRLEMTMFPRAADGDRDGGMCALGHFEDGSTKYYRLKACTTEAETPPNTDIGPTPAPTPAVDDGSEHEPEPAPVDYRGDGDDEDLQDDSDDDSDDDSHDSGDDSGEDSGDGGGGGKDDDENGDSSGCDDKDGHDDADCGDNGNTHDSGDNRGDSGDGDSDSDSDSHDADTQDGHKGGDSSDDELSGNSVFAIAFGCSVAVLICLLSGLLALAGSGGEKKDKVHPKC